MEEFGTPVAHLHNVVSYLTRGVTAFSLMKWVHHGRPARDQTWEEPIWPTISFSCATPSTSQVGDWLPEKAAQQFPARTAVSITVRDLASAIAGLPARHLTGVPSFDEEQGEESTVASDRRTYL